MAFSVEDFQDLLRLLEQHPEWRAELRRHVLTEELLGLPALVQQLAERLDALTARVEALAEAQARTEARVEALAEAQARTEAQLERLTWRMDELAASVRQLVAQGADHTARLGDLTGEVLELRYARRAPSYFSRLARGLRLVDLGRLADQLDDAVAAGQLTDDERNSLLAADIVLSGRRREDQEPVYVLVEVSYGIGRSDVQRAADRARLLEKLGRPVLPVVAGNWTDPETDRMARAYGVWQVLDGRAIPPSEAASA
ncbi:MAG TPA: hypothetical protein VFE37_10775 [Chloroflexota bacterium]|nr:hypothetical protein [Chloroflexota bacterium]